MTPTAEPTPPRRRTRRAFLALMGTAGAGLAGYAYARHFEPEHFEVRRVPVPRSRFPAPVGFRILHLSDLHYGPDVSLAMIAAALRLGLAEKPDLICLTGDYVTGRLRDAEAYAATLRPLAEAAPTFACTGNHDGLPRRNPGCEGAHHGRVPEMLRAAGIRYLLNEKVSVPVRGAQVTVAGLGDLWVGQNAPEICFDAAGAPVADAPTLLLNHNPDAAESARDYPWHLMLCGHTHGGQCGLPFLREWLSPVRDKSLISGLHERHGRLIHITHGVGNLHGVRILCRPQVSLLEVV